MNVAINLMQVMPDRPQGVATYAHELIAHMQNHLLEGDRLFVLHRSGLELPRLEANARPITLTAPESWLNRASVKISRSVLGKPVLFPRLQRLLKRLHIDVLHYPGAAIPPEDVSVHVPVVQTVHDIQHEYFPDFFSEAELAARQSAFRLSCKKSAKVIASSAHTKQTLVEKLDVSAEKITVIHLAGRRAKERALVTGLPRRFIFYPAGTWPHKNHQNLLRAVRLLIDRGRFDGKVILTGYLTSHSDEIFRASKRLGLEGIVTHLGQVTDSQIEDIYSRASLLVFPSLFEGFGIPVLDAMNMRLPVVCSNAASLPEVAGEAASYFDPFDPVDIANAIDRAWSRESLRAALIRKGSAQAARFSWDETARATMAVYREAARFCTGQSRR